MSGTMRGGAGPDAGRPTPEGPLGWTFLTNHSHVLVAVSRDPELRQRDISQQVGITQGAVQRILDDLEAGGYVRRQRVGRRNRYEVIADRPLRHPLEQPRTVADLLEAVEA
ncbi:MAG TPA: helix-turn-helix domain-containing protein [Acidimicrobiales bacterium]|nr:helix-turn-helix domain-containing protein [Acidimicrobiales bacterium]